MKWKLFLIVLINLFSVFFPANIIGCGGEIDPYDYYTSFFQNDLSGSKNFEPFYYTNSLFLYDNNEPVDVAHATSAEWIEYCGNKASHKEAYDFVCHFSYDDLEKLYNKVEKNEDILLADSLTKNNITKYFLQHKDLEALGYLMYAKKIEPNVTGTWNEWEELKRDSLKMDRLIKDGKQLYAAAKNEFVKLRYGYQITRLALYSKNAKDCIRYYDEMIKENTTKSILQDLSVSLKAGALLRTGNKYEAAILFSKLFSRSSVKLVSNYLSFDWCVKRLEDTDRLACLHLCKTDVEKANLLGLFALGSNVREETTLKKIYAYDPNSEMLQVLAVREINKIEENYFTGELDNKKGGSIMLIQNDAGDNEDSSKWFGESKTLSQFYHSVANNPKVHNKALFEVGAAYLAYIMKDYEQAKKYLASIDQLNPSQKIKDQAALTQLLISINQKSVIDSAFETELLPSIQWLEKKVMAEKVTIKKSDYEDWPESSWQKFYRNVFAQIFVKQYHKQKDILNEVLCMGAAENIMKSSYATQDFIENNMQTKDLLALNKILSSDKRSLWKDYLCKHFPITIDKVKEVIAVSHIRDYHFELALKWMKEIKDKELLKLEHNPFGDLLFDWHDSSFSFDKGSFDKISFLKTMAALKKKEKNGVATSNELYKLAVGYYNMTYYGRAWEMVRYNRTGSDGFFIPPDAIPYEKEYYGCFTAEKYYRKAFIKSSDSNFKARCLFMMAKCVQKRVPHKSPDYDFGYNNNNLKDFLAFKYSKYFPQLVKDYRNTKFFNEAYNTCSYLRDFVNKK